MSDTNRPNLDSQVTQITDPLLRVAKAKGDTPTLLVTTLLDGVLRDAGTRQADVLRRCAIPHWVDVGVMGVLRERDDGNDRVLEKLRAYSFVRPIGDDRYAYHDQVRQALLAEWRTKDPERLQAIHLQLYTYFDTMCRTASAELSHDEATRGEQPRGMVAMGMWDSWRREALYHLLCADRTRGLAELQRAFDLLLQDHRLAEAEALLQMAEEVPLDDQAKLIVRYLYARLAQGALRLSSASDMLNKLHGDAALGGELRAQVEQTLAEIYAETGQWVHATELYRSSLAYWQKRQREERDPQAQERAARAVANVMMLLGEAYFGLASNTGGWYISATQPSPVMKRLVAIWEWLLGLPFVIIAWFLRRTRWELPKPHYCAHYQNWLLIRLYRTAQEWFGSANDAFEVLGDTEGVLRTKQHLARILLVYGYTDEAYEQFNALLASPVAHDPYQRRWLERFVAEALLEKNDAAAAQPLLEQGLKLFRALGDVRREAAVLALQGRAAAQAGAVEDALQSYKTSLERFRALNYTAARELILHDLRVWSRRSTDAALRAKIIGVIAAEPFKRYMARFPRALLPLLQGVSLLALPLALLLLAWVSPTAVVRVLAGDQPLSTGIFFDPVRALGVGIVLLPLYLASYAFLAMTVISLLPISRIDREQPDFLVTSPEGIALYNRTGALAQYMGWSTVRRKYTLDRCIWSRPLPLYSRTFLEDQLGNDLRIDGITGWYVSLVADVEHHLAQTAGPVEERDLGYALLRSKSGLSCVIAALLLLLYAGSENGWLPLLRVLPPIIYTMFGMLTLSGVLFLVPLGYWLALRPLKLQRTLNLSSSWPWVVVVVGAMPILAFGLSLLSVLLQPSMEYQSFNTLLGFVNRSTLLPILTYSTVVWGFYMVAEGVSALLFVGRARLRRIVVASVVALSMLVLLPLLVPLFFDQWASVATRRAAVISDSSASMREIDAAASAAYSASVRAYEVNPDPLNLINQGSAQFYAQRYDEALELYTRAIDVSIPDSREQALAYFNRSQAQLKRDDSEKSNEDLQRAKMICSQPSLASDLLCNRILSEGSRILPIPAPSQGAPTSEPGSP